MRQLTARRTRSTARPRAKRNKRAQEIKDSACRARGGEVLGEIRSMGDAGRYAFICDPGGAVCALFEPPS